jgi:hypothetical protein
MLAPPMLPSLCVVKLAAALVLLEVSALSVVVGLNGVAAEADKQEERRSKDNGTWEIIRKGTPGVDGRPRDDEFLHINWKEKLWNACDSRQRKSAPISAKRLVLAQVFAVTRSRGLNPTTEARRHGGAEDKPLAVSK